MEITIAHRFCGPPYSGHGGYTSGLIARGLEGAVEITLRSPIPLGKPLTLLSEASDRTELQDDGQLIALANRAEFELDIPEPPTYEEAVAASVNSVGLRPDYLYPTCFACGHKRESGDGLRICPGAIGRDGIVAAPWTPDSALAEHGKVLPEFVWAALDCPSGIASMGDHVRPLLLGRYAVRIFELPIAGAQYVVMGWPISNEGRKFFSASALFSGDRCMAYARATWIEVKQSD